jgi:hypothetical protein
MVRISRQSGAALIDEGRRLNRGLDFRNFFTGWLTL